jgi:crotonobetainyl-CoA:carnitine CoA-transferase CaiB-like acyl-CoA transferase
MPSPNRILEGVRIIAFTTGYAGPYAGRLLGQFGAEVIKVESYSGGLDGFRHFGQYQSIDAAPRFIECNLATRSLTVNLKHPTGIRIIKELAAHSDAILINFRPQVLDRLGLGNEELRKVNSSLIILKMPGLGLTGQKSWYGTWGFNLNSFSGMTYLWNHPGQERPIGSQGVYPDHLGFVMGPTAMVAALLHRKLTGKGITIDLAQIEATAYTLGVNYLDTAINGTASRPRGNKDPQLRHRNYFERYVDSPIGPFEIPKGALQFKDMTEEPIPLTPLLGAHTDQILGKVLGYDEATIKKWKKEGILN